VTTLITGEINRLDGLDDVVVGTVTAEGAQALVFEGLDGALKAKPEAINLPDEAQSLALGQLVDDAFLDLAITAGRELLIVHGRDRILSSYATKQAAVAKPIIERRGFSSGISALALGNFAGDRELDVALLSEDGAVRVLSGSMGEVKKGLQSWGQKVVRRGPWQEADMLVKARLTNQSTDDLVMVDPKNNQLHILKSAASRFAQQGAPVIAALEVSDDPVALFPMRLNSDASTDLVLLITGHSAPTVALTAVGTTFTVTNTNNSGTGSFTQAIIDANSNPGADGIDFNIQGPGPHIINSSLPDITETVTIDGTTEPDFSGTPIIEVNGQLAVTSDSGDGTVVRGLDIDGILLTADSAHHMVEGNFIRDVALNPSDLCLIGGTVAQARNIISGGILAITSGAHSIKGNFFGTDATGTAHMGRGDIISRVGSGTIGGPEAGARNIITGRLLLENAEPVLVQNNFLGTDVTGTVGLTSRGLFLDDPGLSNTIKGNVISRSVADDTSGEGDGLTIRANGGGMCLVQDNLIGTDVTGTLALGNMKHGLVVDNFSGSLSKGNVVSGNGGIGILVISGQHILHDNYIGTDRTGFLAMGNGRDGIFIEALDQDIQRNTIAFNNGVGINVRAVFASALILSNSIFSNTGLGIGAIGEGITPNDPCDVDLGSQNYPVLESVSVSNTGTTIQGSLSSTPNSTFTLEFFSNSVCDPSGFGEGETLIASTTVTTDNNCNADFTLNLPGVNVQGRFITATATDSANVTSEFSMCRQAVCLNSIATTSLSFASNGGTGSVDVSAAGGCDWTATSDSSFITIITGATGNGNDIVKYSVGANPNPTARSGTMTIAGQTFTVLQGATFLDVPQAHPFFTEIGKLSARGVTLGCDASNYCPDQVVTRQQMAAFIIRALGEFDPPVPPVQRFLDVPPENPFYRFIDRMAVLGITQGCNDFNYCPSDPVLRDQMAAFIIRALGEFNPPVPPSQRFFDVPPTNPFYRFIDRMAVLQITLGCGGGNYCPTLQVSRGQMAAFLVRAFNL
jgi:hypothetical protein